MNTNNEQSLYAQFCAFAQQFIYTSEDGVMEKIDAALQDQVKSQQVKTFTRTFDADTHHYTLQIQMHELSIKNAYSIFDDIHQIIDFGVGLYAIKDMDDVRHYLLISLRENRKGIYCEMNFTS